MRAKIAEFGVSNGRKSRRRQNLAISPSGKVPAAKIWAFPQPEKFSPQKSGHFPKRKNGYREKLATIPMVADANHGAGASAADSVFGTPGRLRFAGCAAMSL